LGPLPGAPSIPEKMILVDMVKINVYCRNGKELIIPFSPILQPPYLPFLEIDSSKPPLHTVL
jgi:hypothetical protein